MNVRDEDKMDESSNDEIFARRDFRKKKEKKRSHKNTKEKEKEECTREGFKKMKQEIDELRKKEAERAEELEKLKQQIEQSGSMKQEKEKEKFEFALGYNEDEYLNKGFIESAQWIKNVIAKNMSEKILQDQHKMKFLATSISKKASTHMGIRTCARYNRGEICNLGKWHATHKSNSLWSCNDARQRINKGSSQENIQDLQQPEQHGRRNELRLHACTLCLEALMSINGHSVLNCPWIQKKNWSD